MGDAFTDIAKEQRQADGVRGFLEVVADYIESPSKENFDRVAGYGYEAAGFIYGYNARKQLLVVDLKEVLDKLSHGDERQWGRILQLAEGSPHHYGRLKSISPYADKLLVVVDYGSGFVSLHGDIQAFFDGVIAEGKNWKTYDCDKYMVVLDKPDPDKTEVVWLDSGYCLPKITGPRERRRH